MKEILIVTRKNNVTVVCRVKESEKWRTSATLQKSGHTIYQFKTAINGVNKKGR